MAMAVSDTILSFVGFHASLLREDCTPRPEARGRNRKVRSRFRPALGFPPLLMAGPNLRTQPLKHDASSFTTTSPSNNA
jgi:hypothetical protein